MSVHYLSISLRQYINFICHYVSTLSQYVIMSVHYLSMLLCQYIVLVCHYVSTLSSYVIMSVHYLRVSLCQFIIVICHYSQEAKSVKKRSNGSECQKLALNLLSKPICNWAETTQVSLCNITGNLIKLIKTKFCAMFSAT